MSEGIDMSLRGLIERAQERLRKYDSKNELLEMVKTNNGNIFVSKQFKLRYCIYRRTEEMSFYYYVSDLHKALDDVRNNIITKNAIGNQF